MARPPCGSTGHEHMRRIGKAGFPGVRPEARLHGREPPGRDSVAAAQEEVPRADPWRSTPPMTPCSTSSWKQVEPEEEDPIALHPGVDPVGTARRMGRVVK